MISDNITKNDIKFFNIAKAISEKGENNKNIKIGAVAVLNNKAISTGYNRFKTDPIQAKYAKYLTNDKNVLVHKCHLHAEIDCLKKISHMNIQWGKVKIYVYRPLKTKEFGLARPCASCMQYIHDLGIKHVYYTTNIGYSHEIIL